MCRIVYTEDIRCVACVCRCTKGNYELFQSPPPAFANFQRSCFWGGMSRVNYLGELDVGIVSASSTKPYVKEDDDSGGLLTF